jgi:hypothetical protein
MSAPSTLRASTLQGIACPTPVQEHARVLLGHGSGGKLSAQLLR